MAQISILKVSQIEKDNLGAEYYHPEKLKALNKVQKLKNRIGDYFISVKEINRELKKNGKTINLQNIGNGFINSFSCGSCSGLN